MTRGGDRDRPLLQNHGLSQTHCVQITGFTKSQSQGPALRMPARVFPLRAISAPKAPESYLHVGWAGGTHRILLSSQPFPRVPSSPDPMQCTAKNEGSSAGVPPGSVAHPSYPPGLPWLGCNSTSLLSLSTTELGAWGGWGVGGGERDSQSACRSWDLQ